MQAATITSLLWVVVKAPAEHEAELPPQFETLSCEPSRAKLLPPVPLNAAVSVITAFIVTVAGLFEPLYEPEPEPAQLEKEYPLFADALTWTLVPESYQPVSPGTLGAVVAEAVPPVPAVTVI
jgi:hypothetical protein